MIPTPITTTVVSFGKLLSYQRDAVIHQLEESGILPKEIETNWFRVETYNTSDILDNLFRTRWGWPSNISNLSHQDDVNRVDKIIRLIKTTGIRWPYYSYYAADMAELWTGADDNPEDYCFNHGAGWHRMMAQEHLGFKTVELIFDCSKP